MPIKDRKQQRFNDSVTNKILQQAELKDKYKNRTIDDLPLQDEHPGLDLALMYAQPGNVIAKAFAPSMAKGFVNGLRQGDLQQAVISGLVPESKVLSPIAKTETIIPKNLQKEITHAYHYDPRVIPMSRPISEAERLGIPKGERSNPKALEYPQYWGYQQWNDRYNAAVESGNVKEGRRLIDLHETRNAPDTKIKEDQFHGTNNREFNEMDSTKNPGRTVGAGSKLSNFFSDADVANAYLIDAQGMGTWYNGPGRIIRARLNIKNPYIFDYEGAKFNGIGGSAKKYNYLTKTFTDVQNNQLKYFPTESDFIGQWRSENKYLGKIVNGKDYVYTESKVKPTIAELVDNIDRNVYDGAIIKNITELDIPVVDYVTFTPNQVKLSNVITYDDYGNMIPIVKRHNYHIKDMRFKHGGIIEGQKGISDIQSISTQKDNTKINTGINSNVEQPIDYVQEFFDYDVAPRYARENPNATEEELQTIRNINNIPQLVTKYSDAYSGKTIFPNNVHVLGVPYGRNPHIRYTGDPSNETMVHELTHGYRQGLFKNHGKQKRFGIRPLVWMNRHTGYNQKETDYINKAYDMTGSTLDKDTQFIEKGTTNSELRYHLWKQLYDNLGRRPTLDETDEYIKNYDTYLPALENLGSDYSRHIYQNMLYDINNGYKQKENIDYTPLKEALIHVADNNQVSSNPNLSKSGGVIKGQNGFFNTWKKAYNSKFGKGVRDFLNGKDSELSNKEYISKHGYAKPVGGLGPLVEMTTTGPVADFSGVKNIVKGTFGNGGVKANVGLQSMKTERRALDLAKSYDEEVKRNKAALDWAGKRWDELNNTQQYWLKVNHGNLWNDKLIIPRNKL